MSGWHWSYDGPPRSAWDGTAPNGQRACVAKDGTGEMPWGAYHTREEGAGHPDSWHRTKAEAQRACEEAIGG